MHIGEMVIFGAIALGLSIAASQARSQFVAGVLIAYATIAATLLFIAAASGRN
jgi:hypothetical protein